MHQVTQNGILITKKKKNKKQTKTTDKEIKHEDRSTDINLLIRKHPDLDNSAIIETYDFFQGDMGKTLAELNSMMISKTNFEVNNMLDVEEEISIKSLSLDKSTSDTYLNREHSNNEYDILNEINTQIQSYFHDIHKDNTDNRDTNKVNKNLTTCLPEIQDKDCRKDIQKNNHGKKAQNDVVIVKKTAKKNKKKGTERYIKWDHLVEDKQESITKSDDKDFFDEHKSIISGQYTNKADDAFIDEHMIRKLRRSYIRYR